MKKLLINFLLLFSFAQALEQEPIQINQQESVQTEEQEECKSGKTYMIYSHGFGEGKERSAKNDFTFLGHEASMPEYPDAPGRFDKAVFYTKPAVHTLVNDLYDKAHREDCQAIKLVGRSNGAGIAVNCLTKLANYDENLDYFKGSKVSSKEDAQKIMQKINDGAFISTAPLLDLRKANAIANPSKMLVGATIAGATVGACHFVPSLCKDSVESKTSQLICLTAGMALYYTVGDRIKNVYADILHSMVPYVTGFNFDPYHETPLQSVEKLRGKLTCPVLLHFNEQDGVLENPDEDTVKMYDALKGEKTHIIITNDAWHNTPSQQFSRELERFENKYFKKQENDMSATQPTVKELEKNIAAAQNIFEKTSYIFWELLEELVR